MSFLDIYPFHKHTYTPSMKLNVVWWCGSFRTKRFQQSASTRRAQLSCYNRCNRLLQPSGEMDLLFCYIKNWFNAD